MKLRTPISEIEAIGDFLQSLSSANENLTKLSQAISKLELGNAELSGRFATAVVGAEQKLQEIAQLMTAVSTAALNTHVERNLVSK